jgi:hypothetical protein
MNKFHGKTNTFRTLERWYPTTKLLGVTTQKTSTYNTLNRILKILAVTQNS